MIDISKVAIYGVGEAMSGMRNPMNSWSKGDTHDGVVGPMDRKLAMSLSAGGPCHAKYRRMIEVYADITAPLYWWKEFDTYKVGTVANSCSTMHKIHSKVFDIGDFSIEHLLGRSEFDDIDIETFDYGMAPKTALLVTIDTLNKCREAFLATKDKKYWWQMIQLLPSSYNQKRTVLLSYEVLANIYEYRRDHKLDEWRAFCKWIESLPYSEFITGEEVDDGKSEENK